MLPGRSFLVAGALLTALALCGFRGAEQASQEAGSAAHAASEGRPSTPESSNGSDQKQQLEALFAALKQAPDEASASMIADRLDRMFGKTDSPAIDLLMARANAAMQVKAYDLALDLLGQSLRIEPDDLGARARRATIYYLQDDYGRALADIREVLAREPRHFTMLYGLALILKDIGEDRLALEATRKALAVNPHLESAQELEKELDARVEGREI
ncbi:tetratricopeptide repeat protein [Xanthobacter sp. TB0139]|uniref:tetratricopeptide repeat protein n=1 Tax=Xanthobacter sp. TB0139 TaxID=3459178 RepID=UPI0040391AC0